MFGIVFCLCFYILIGMTGIYMHYNKYNNILILCTMILVGIFISMMYMTLPYGDLFITIVTVLFLI